MVDLKKDGCDSEEEVVQLFNMIVQSAKDILSPEVWLTPISEAELEASDWDGMNLVAVTDIPDFSPRAAGRPTFNASIKTVWTTALGKASTTTPTPTAAASALRHPAVSATSYSTRWDRQCCRAQDTTKPKSTPPSSVKASISCTSTEPPSTRPKRLSLKNKPSKHPFIIQK